MSKKTLNVALIIIITAGIIGFISVWFNYGKNPDANQAPSLTEKELSNIVLEGYAASEKNANLGFPISERISFISKKVGDVVKKGEVLAIQESSDLSSQLDAANANIDRAQFQYNALLNDLKKEKLKAHDLDGNDKKQQKAQILSSKSELDAQKSAIIVARNNAESVRAQLAKTILKAPFDGIITRQDSQVGEINGPGVAPFMTISSNEPLRKIEAIASDLDVSQIKIGDSAKVSFDVFSKDKIIAAKVISIDPASILTNGKNVYKVTLELNDSDKNIKSGMHASVLF